VLYHGLEVLGGGAILGGLVLGAIGVCVIDRTFSKAPSPKPLLLLSPARC